MKLSLNSESAQALREFADAMPRAMDSLVAATERLLSTYSSVSGGIGVHNEEFYHMLMCIKAVQDSANESVMALPPLLRYTAEQIDAFVANKPDIGN